MTTPPPAPMQPTPPPYGAPVQPGYAPTPPAPEAGKGLSIGALVVGVLSLILCGLGIILGPVAVVLGIVAGRKGKHNGMSITGIITGAVGFVLSAIAVVGGVATFLDQREQEAAAESPYVWEDEQPTEIATDAAETPSDDATSGEDDWYAGIPVETPCFTIAGESLWDVLDDGEVCSGWTTLTADTTVNGETEELQAEIWLFPLTQELPADATLADAATVLAEQVLPENGLEVTGMRDVTVGGAQAIAIDVLPAGFENAVVYVIEPPRTYPEAGSTPYFSAQLVLDSASLTSWDDMVARFEDTTSWK